MLPRKVSQYILLDKKFKFHTYSNNIKGKPIKQQVNNFFRLVALKVHLKHSVKKATYNKIKTGYQTKNLHNIEIFIEALEKVIKSTKSSISQQPHSIPSKVEKETLNNY